MLPPLIHQKFSRDLLTTRFFLGDNADKILEKFNKIEARLSRRARNQPKKQAKMKDAKEKFLKHHERAKTKEKELKEETGIQGKGPFYFVFLDDKNDRELLARLRSKKWFIHSKMRNDEVC